MNELFMKLSKGVGLTGDVKADAYHFIARNGYPKIAEHSQRVAQLAKAMAARFSLDEEEAEIAGWLHDVSVVFPNDSRISVAESLGIQVLPEERKFPLIIHQKISKVMAEQIFHVNNEAILSAIECHTTLKEQASPMDMNLFVADKIEWDQSGQPPYLNEIKEAATKSLEGAAFVYIDYMWRRRDRLKVVHPWLEAAYWQLKGIEGRE